MADGEIVKAPVPQDAYIVSPGIETPFEFPLTFRGWEEAFAKALSLSMSVKGIQKVIKRQDGKSRETMWFKDGKRL